MAARPPSRLLGACRHATGFCTRAATLSCATGYILDVAPHVATCPAGRPPQPQAVPQPGPSARRRPCSASHWSRRIAPPRRAEPAPHAGVAPLPERAWPAQAGFSVASDGSSVLRGRLSSVGGGTGASIAARAASSLSSASDRGPGWSSGCPPTGCAGPAAASGGGGKGSRGGMDPAPSGVSTRRHAAAGPPHAARRSPWPLRPCRRPRLALECAEGVARRTPMCARRAGRGERAGGGFERRQDAGERNGEHARSRRGADSRLASAGRWAPAARTAARPGQRAADHPTPASSMFVAHDPCLHALRTRPCSHGARAGSFERRHARGRRTDDDVGSWLLTSRAPASGPEGWRVPYPRRQAAGAEAGPRDAPDQRRRLRARVRRRASPDAGAAAARLVDAVPPRTVRRRGA
jgi:hypothetical protein